MLLSAPSAPPIPSRVRRSPSPSPRSPGSAAPPGGGCRMPRRVRPLPSTPSSSPTRKLLGSTMGKDVDPVVREVNRQLFAATAPQVRSDFFQCTRGWDVRAALPSVTVPAVVLHGEADKVIDLALAETLASVIPGARFERVPGAGHMLPLERPLLAASAVVELASR